MSWNIRHLFQRICHVDQARHLTRPINTHWQFLVFFLTIFSSDKIRSRIVDSLSKTRICLKFGKKSVPDSNPNFQYSFIWNFLLNAEVTFSNVKTLRTINFWVYIYLQKVNSLNVRNILFELPELYVASLIMAITLNWQDEII